MTDVGCPACDYGLPTACTCEEHARDGDGLPEELETLLREPRIVMPGETELWSEVAECLWKDVRLDT